MTGLLLHISDLNIELKYHFDNGHLKTHLISSTLSHLPNEVIQRGNLF